MLASDERWRDFDAAFDEALDGVPLAEPLRHHQQMVVPGLPKPRSEHTLTDDPRQWAKFVRQTLVDGRLVRDNLIATSGGGGHMLLNELVDAACCRVRS